MTTQQIKILLIESNKGDVLLLKECLNEVKLFDFTLKVTDNIEKAVSLLNKLSIDIVLIDPVFSNCESELGTYCKKFPFIVITNLESSHYKKFFEMGAQDFIKKAELSSGILERSIYFCFERFNNLVKLKSYSKKLEISERKLLQAQKIAQLGNWELNLKKFKVEWSAEMYKIFGKDPEKYDPSFPSFIRSVHPDDREFIKHIFSQAMTTSLEFNIDHRMVHDDGRIIYLNTHIVSLVEKKKIFGTIQDITSRKTTELALIESEDRYQKFFHESMDGIFVSSFDGAFIEFNEAMLKMFGYRRLEFKNLNSSKLYDDPNDAKKLVSIVRKKGAIRNMEIKLRKKTGSTFEGLITTHIWKTKESKPFGYYAILRDVTDHNRSLELLRQKELSDRSSQLKQVFLAKMSHEIRTPLNGIIGMANILGETELDQKQSHFLQTIKSSADHLMALVSDVLDFSKIETGNLKLEDNPFDIHELVEYLVETMQIRAGEKDIQLYSIIASSTPVMVKGDKVKLNQVLINLISNAIKFTDEGYIIVDIKPLELTDHKVSIKFSVKDSGIGISRDQLSSIFESFTQVSENIEKQRGGSGLGLTISKELVELMGGRIKVESEVNQGSTFSFNLEFKIEKDFVKDTEKSTLIRSKSSVEKARILIAEDNPINLIVVKENLKKWITNLHIDEAKDGNEAYRYIKENEYDLLILDIQMPELDGLQLSRLIRSSNGNFNQFKPILSLTAFADDIDKEACIEAGMNEYISKPFNAEVLREKVTRLLQMETGKQDEGERIEVSKFSYLERVTRDNPELRDRLVGMLNTELPAALSHMSDEAGIKNWEGIKRISHKLISSVAFLGSDNIVEKVRLIEHYAENDPEKVNDSIRDLKLDLDKQLHLLNKGVNFVQ